MKKLFFNVTLMFFMGAFAFASSTKENVYTSTQVNEVFGICSYSITITITYSNGDIVEYTQNYTTTANSALECSLIAARHAARLQQAYN